MEQPSRNTPQTTVIDTHCHLHYDYHPKFIGQVIQEAQEAGVSALVTVAIDRASCEQIEQLADTYPSVYFTAGVHPHDVHHPCNQDLFFIEKAGQHPKCVAIGEIGLDTYYDTVHFELQKEFLEKQIDLANQLKKPPVFHVRGKPHDATETELLHFLKKVKTPGIIHCFGGTALFGKACLDLGFYISFSGIITFKNAQSLHAFAKTVPLSQLLVETDAPYLAPIPFRGKQCTPAMVIHTAHALALLRQESFETLAHATSENAKRVFGIP